MAEQVKITYKLKSGGEVNQAEGTLVSSELPLSICVDGVEPLAKVKEGTMIYDFICSVVPVTPPADSEEAEGMVEPASPTFSYRHAVVEKNAKAKNGSVLIIRED